MNGMKKIKSMLAFVLAFVLVVGCVPVTAFAATEYQNAFGFSDFPTGWSKDAMTDAVENGLITGYEDGTVRPGHLLTRAEMATIINRAFGAEIKADIAGKYSDVSPDDWYYDEMAKAVNMRTFTGYEDGTMHPDNPITRQEAILVIARALVINSEDPHLLDVFVDKNEIGEFAKGAIATFVLRDYIHGYEDSTIRPNNYITREEFAQIMYNIFAAYVRNDGTVTLGDCEGEVILTGDNVHLYSTVINGDLIIGDGVGATNVALENVIIKGRIVFRGGEGLVTLRNVTKDDLIVTNDYNGTVNFYHYSTEAYFKNAVYNTPASFLDRTVPGGTASGTGLGAHDTHTEGRIDAGTGVETKPSSPVINPGTGGRPVTTYYTVTYYVDGTQYDQKGNILSGGNVGTLPADPTVAGYVFKGWVYDLNGVETEFKANTIITANTTVNAKLVKLHTVTFLDDKGGNIFGTPAEVEDGQTVAPPATNPEKEGHTFSKWVHDTATGTEEFTAATVVEGDITVYPEWTQNPYTVTFYDKGVQHAQETVLYGEDFTAAMMPADPAGEGFEGWYYDHDNDTTTPDVAFTAPVTVTANIIVNAKWAATFTVTYYVDGTQYDQKDNILSGGNVGTLPADPTVAGYVFKGWVYDLAGVETPFTATTAIYADTTVNAKLVKLYTVTFYEYGIGGEERHSVVVEENATVSEADITTAEGALDEFFLPGYEASNDKAEESYISDSTVARIHEIAGQWYYDDGTDYVPFDENVVVTSDIDVYYYFNTMYALVNLESILGQMGNYAFEVPFAEDTLASESVLDFLWLNKPIVKTLILNASKPIFDKNIKLNAKGIEIDYTPINAKGEIMNMVYNYRLIDLLGEETVRDYTHDAVVNLVKGDRAILRTAVLEKLEMAGHAANTENHEIVDEFILSDDVIKVEFESIAKRHIAEDHPEFNETRLNQAVAEIMNDKAKRIELIQYAFSQRVYREEIADVITDEIKLRITADEECEFTDYVVDIAKKAYDDEIETFISQLKNDDAYLINTEDDGTDRRFIINAVSEKLATTTLDTIKDKLPDVVFKVLDEEVVDEIFNTTLNNYIAEVEEVKNAVWADGYDGTAYYVSSYVPVTINPVIDGFVPMYDKAMAKLDPKIKGYKYYTLNPYIAELEALLDYNELIAQVDDANRSEDSSGYSLKMDGDAIDSEAYFALVYRIAILTYDAAEWFINNVPEEELDDTINLMADRIGGYYDKLSTKVSYLTTGKATELKTKAYDLLAKIVDKDNETIWNTTTSKIVPEKLETAYNKAYEVVLEKSGFDITNDITVTIADDCKTVTLEQGTRVVTKTVKDIAKDIEKAGHIVSVQGSVITVDGKTKVDVADYAKKLADKFGYTFKVRFAEDATELAKPEILLAYILEVNTDYIQAQIYLK